MSTIKDAVKEKIRKAETWEENNPGRPYVIEYAERSPSFQVPRDEFNSPAFKSLSHTAKLVLFIFYSKRLMVGTGPKSKKVWRMTNNGLLVFPYAEAETEWGISRSAFVQAIDELQRKGFIEITHQGRGGRKPAKGTGDYSTYALVTRFKDFDAERGVSRIQPKRPRKKDERHRGFRIPEVKQRAAEKKVKYKKCTPNTPMEYKFCTPISELIEAENQ